tara:strand:- start:91 stop:285 length:195 start_codon:yes stop_codon:yes gene_type:complete
MNNKYWLTKDISISTDSVGCRTATHRYQGLLIDSSPWENSRAECRQEAVKILREMKQEKQLDTM